MLIDLVRFTLPHGPASEGEEAASAEVCMADGLGGFELESIIDGEVASNGGVARIEVVWKSKLGMEPLRIDYELQPPNGEAGEARHTANLPEGLTLARVLERTRPVARVNSGTRFEREIYR